MEALTPKAIYETFCRHVKKWASYGSEKGGVYWVDRNGFIHHAKTKEELEKELDEIDCI